MNFNIVIFIVSTLVVGAVIGAPMYEKSEPRGTSEASAMMSNGPYGSASGDDYDYYYYYYYYYDESDYYDYGCDYYEYYDYEESSGPSDGYMGAAPLAA